jgi:transposase
VNYVNLNMCHAWQKQAEYSWVCIDNKTHNAFDKEAMPPLYSHKHVYINSDLLPMPTPPSQDPKLRALQASHTLHPHPDKVRHSLFTGGGFFDARDLLQVKYEALRAIQVDGRSLSQVARDFGLSRPTVYETKSLFALQGLDGLVPRKAGPKTAHKFTPEVLEYLQATRTQEPAISAEQLARQLKQRFRVTVHPRSIERALVRHQGKRGRPNPPPQNP